MNLFHQGVCCHLMVRLIGSLPVCAVWFFEYGARVFNEDRSCLHRFGALRAYEKVFLELLQLGGGHITEQITLDGQSLISFFMFHIDSPEPPSLLLGLQPRRKRSCRSLGGQPHACS